MTTSVPVPALDRDLIARLRFDVIASRWTIDTLSALLSADTLAALMRDSRLPALVELAGVADPAATLTRFFILGQPERASALAGALPTLGAQGLETLGLAAVIDEAEAASGLVMPRACAKPTSTSAPTRERAEAGEDGEASSREAPTLPTMRDPDEEAPESEVEHDPWMRALFDLRPHAAALPGGDHDWWVTSDLGEAQTGRPLADDHVLGIGGATLTLLEMTVRDRVDSALDLGGGCGIQALYLATHADRVVATDLSARACALTQFNAALNETVIDVREGSLFEPVAGEAFDLIVSNPPFVLTPPAVREAGLPLMEYRDAGGPVLPELVAGLREHLEPGAAAVMLGNWEHRGADSWREAVATWIPEGLDGWVIEREVQDPVEYATMWLRDGGLTSERDAEGFDAALGAWIDDFEVRGVQGVGFGYLIVHRPLRPRDPWRLLEEVTTSGQGVLGHHVAEVLEVRERLAGLDDDAVADLRPVLAPDVTEERHLIPGAAEPTVILLRQGGGLGRTIRASTVVAALAGVADGELSVGQIASAVVALTGEDAIGLRAEMVEATRHLIAVGFLTID